MKNKILQQAIQRELAQAGKVRYDPTNPVLQGIVDAGAQASHAGKQVVDHVQRYQEAQLRRAQKQTRRLAQAKARGEIKS